MEDHGGQAYTFDYFRFSANLSSLSLRYQSLKKVPRPFMPDVEIGSVGSVDVLHYPGKGPGGSGCS
jgi:hypothetical protein